MMGVYVSEVLLFKSALEKLLRGNIPVLSSGICHNARKHFFDAAAKTNDIHYVHTMTADWQTWMEEQFAIWPNTFICKDLSDPDFGHKSINFPVGGKDEYHRSMKDDSMWRGFNDDNVSPKRKELLLFLIERVNVLAEPILKQQAQSLSNKIGY